MQVAMTKIQKTIIVKMITATTAAIICEKSLPLFMVPLLRISMCPRLYSSVLDMNTFIDLRKQLEMYDSQSNLAIP